MKRVFVLGAVIALAACNQADAPDTAAEGDATAAADDSVLEGEAPGFEAVAPGTYEVTRAGGEVDYVEIHPGMTFSRVDADGNATGGSIFMRDGETCFQVEGQEEANCFTDGPTQADGSMETTNADGGVASVRPVEGTLEDHVGA